MNTTHTADQDQFSRFMDNAIPPDAWMVIGTCLTYLFWIGAAWYAYDTDADYGATIITFLPIAGILFSCYSGFWLLSDHYLDQSGGLASIACIILLALFLLLVAPIYYGALFVGWMVARF